MNFIAKLFNRVKNKSVSFISSSGFSDGLENVYDSLNLKTYKDSLYLFIGVSMIRDSVSSIPLEMYKIKNKDGEVEEVHDHPILDLIHRPNYKQTEQEFWKIAVAYYLLAGETFWYMERGENKNAIPTSIVNLRPDYVDIVLSKDGREVVAYEFKQANGDILTLRPEDILHIKNIDPTNTLRGVGVIRPATMRIVTEKEASQHQANTFKYSGRPDVAVFAESDITDEEGETARERWHKIYGKNKSEVAFFGKNIRDLKLLNVSPKEMDFIASQNFLRDDILAALHIPKAMITSDDVNLANSKTARINYMKEAVEPVLDTFLDVINNKFLYDIEPDTFITYESQVNEDRELLLKETVELKKNGIITTNEARALMNYPEVEDGDTLDAPFSPFQLSLKKKKLAKKARIFINSREKLFKKLDAIEKVTALFIEKAKLNDLQRGRSSVFHSKEMKEAYIKAYNNNIDNKAEGFKETIDVYNIGLLKRIMKRMEDFGINESNIFEVKDEIIECKKIFVPLMTNMFKKAGQQTMDSIANGFSEKASEQFYTVDDMLRALELRAEFFITSMLDTDYKQLKKIIVDGLADGKGVDEIGRDMRGYFNDMSVSRARTIARTETGRLVSQATQEAYKQSEVVTGKEWLSARDGKVRDEHVENDGVIVATNGVFPSGEEYPGQLSINCRCALAPAV